MKTREEIEQEFKAFWEGLNRSGRRDFIKRARRGVDNARNKVRVV